MRRLSGKTINSLALCVALAAPLVYLFGTLFMSLAGAHGNVLLGEEAPYQETTTYTNAAFQKGKREGTTFNQPRDNLNHAILYFHSDKPFQATFNFDRTNLSGDLYMVTYADDLSMIDKITHSFSAPTFGYIPGVHYYSFGYYSANPAETASYIEPSLTIVVTNSPLETNQGNNTLLENFFISDNFLSTSGEKVLEGNPQYGFEPIGELVRYTDANMLHLANLSYGPLVIGYTYYCAHVIIVDLIFYIGSFIPRLIKKTINKLEGGLD